MNSKGIFFRLLHSPAHFDDWKAGRYNSYHFTVPGEWIEDFYKKGLRNPNDFSLDLFSGKHTEKARLNFSRIAGNYPHAAIWSEADRRMVSELDGVCAFKDMASIHSYAQGASYTGMAVVKFEGQYVSEIPESQGGLTGVLVKPHEVISETPYRGV